MNFQGYGNLFPAFQGVCNKIDFIAEVIKFVIAVFPHQVIDSGYLFFQNSLIQDFSLLHKTLLDFLLIDVFYSRIGYIVIVFFDVSRILMSDKISYRSFFGS